MLMGWEILGRKEKDHLRGDRAVSDPGAFRICPGERAGDRL